MSLAWESIWDAPSDRDYYGGRGDPLGRDEEPEESEETEPDEEPEATGEAGPVFDPEEYAF